MDVQIILLDIPQGVVTIASAIVVAFVGALITLAVWVFRLLYSIQGRVSALEASVKSLEAASMKAASVADRVSATNPRVDILWEWHLHWTRNLRAMDAPENPMKQERWNELADKLNREELSDDEAEEFLAALLKREEQAREEKDLAALVILGSGIVLTKWQLKEKELREQA